MGVIGLQTFSGAVKGAPTDCFSSGENKKNKKNTQAAGTAEEGEEELSFINTTQLELSEASPPPPYI